MNEIFEQIAEQFNKAAGSTLKDALKPCLAIAILWADLEEALGGNWSNLEVPAWFFERLSPEARIIVFCGLPNALAEALKQD